MLTSYVLPYMNVKENINHRKPQPQNLENQRIRLTESCSYQ